MPELPDVEIFRRLVERHALGRMIEKVVVPDPGMLEGVTAVSLQRRLKGKSIAAGRRHGKVLFIEVEGAGALALHFGTNGALRYVVGGEEEPPHVRLWLDLADASRLAYLNPRRIGEVRLADGVESFIADAGLGPDALDPAFDLEGFTAALGGGRQAIKAILMDQARIAGIGNIYSDEILFQAGLHPALSAPAIDGGGRRKLFLAMKRVLQTAVDCGAGAEDFTERLPKDFLLPERHEGGHCPRCGSPIRTMKRGGRTGYYCPKCQPEP